MTKLTAKRRLLVYQCLIEISCLIIPLKYVKQYSIIYSDSISEHNAIKDAFFPPPQKKINRLLCHLDPLIKVPTNTIEGNWNGINLTLPLKQKQQQDYNNKIYD